MNIEIDPRLPDEVKRRRRLHIQKRKNEDRNTSIGIGLFASLLLFVSGLHARNIREEQRPRTPTPYMSPTPVPTPTPHPDNVPRYEQDPTLLGKMVYSTGLVERSINGIVDNTCTGELIEEEVAVTPAHCVLQAVGSSVNFTLFDGTELQVERIVADYENDVAVLKLPKAKKGEVRMPAELSDGSLRKGDTIVFASKQDRRKYPDFIRGRYVGNYDPENSVMAGGHVTVLGFDTHAEVANLMEGASGAGGFEQSSNELVGIHTDLITPADSNFTMISDILRIKAPDQVRNLSFMRTATVINYIRERLDE